METGADGGVDDVLVGFLEVSFRFKMYVVVKVWI